MSSPQAQHLDDLAVTTRSGGGASAGSEAGAARTIVILDSSAAVTGGLRGAARIAHSLAPMHRVILVLPRSARIDPCELTGFTEVVRLPLVQLRRTARDLALYVPALVVAGWRLRRLLGRTRASALIVNDFFQLQGAAARLFGFRGCILTWIRCDPNLFPKPVARFWLCAAAWCSDEIVAVSDYIVSRLPSWTRARRIYDAIDPRLQTAALSDPLRRAPDIVQIGNYMEHKGQEVALDAFLQVAAEHPKSRLIFYGGDLGLQKNRDYRRRLEERARTSGFADRIVFNGFVSDISVALSGAAVALNMSVSESFSLTCLEAAQLGVPVVAFRSGGPAEIITDGATGYLCDVGDTAAVAAALRLLLGDPARARRMGEAAAADVEKRFGPAHFSEELWKALDFEQHDEQESPGRRG